MKLPLSIINQQITFQHVLTHNKKSSYILERGKKRKKEERKKSLPFQSSQWCSFHPHWRFLAIEPRAPARRCRRRPRSLAPAQLHPHMSLVACSPTPTRRLVQRCKALRETETVLSSPTCIYLQPFLLRVILVPTPPFSLHLFTSPLYSFDICRRSNRITSQPWFCQMKQAKQAFYFCS